MLNGIDYAWGYPGGKKIKDAGYDFVCRYLSNNVSKNISPPEVKDLHANNLLIVLVWETTEQRALQGYGAGVNDATRALALAVSIECPPKKPIYFACDYDFSYQNQELINDYFQGVSSVIPLPQVGIYAGYDVVKRTLDAEMATYAWQTSAWSRGKWDSRIHIKQIKYGQLINGVSCDINESCQDDFGQW